MRALQGLSTLNSRQHSVAHLECDVLCLFVSHVWSPHAMPLDDHLRSAQTRGFAPAAVLVPSVPVQFAWSSPISSRV